MQSALNEDRTRRELIDNQPPPPDGLKGMNRQETSGLRLEGFPLPSRLQPHAYSLLQGDRSELNRHGLGSQPSS